MFAPAPFSLALSYNRLISRLQICKKSLDIILPLQSGASFRTQCESVVLHVAVTLFFETGAALSSFLCRFSGRRSTLKARAVLSSLRADVLVNAK